MAASSPSTIAITSLLGRIGNRLSSCSKTHQSLHRFALLSVSISHHDLLSSSSNDNLRRNHCSMHKCNTTLFYTTRSLTNLTLSLRNNSYPPNTIISQLPNNHHGQLSNHRHFASKRKQKGRKNNKNSKHEENAPLLNEHLIAELFNEINKKGGGNAKISADTFEVRLIIDKGRDGKKDSDEGENSSKSSSSGNETRIVTVNEAISISHELSLDLMEVTLKQNPPVIKAVSYDKWLYDQKKKQSKKSDKKGSDTGAISDRPLKEFKFRAGIADHDLERKTNNMLKYLAKGHAIRVTLTARQRSLNEDSQAISTTLDRVKELIGDRAVEVRGMKANDRLSYGNLLFHPNKNS